MRQTALNTVCALARRDPRIVFIGSDLGPGLLDDFKTEMPDRFYMEGVSEQSIIGMAAGMAMDGFIPYVNTIATFLTRRCYEQVAIDVCLHELPVRLLANGGGAVYAPLGPTHMALEDIAIMRALPRMTVVCPADAPEMMRVIEASLDWPNPMYVRFGKGGDPIISSPALPFALGQAIGLRAGADVGLISTGIMTSRALAAAELLAQAGIEASVLHVHTVKPLDERAVCDLACSHRLVVTIEEHSAIGGLGSAVCDLLAAAAISVPTLRIAFPDRFVGSYGSQDSVLESVGLDPAALAHTIQARYAAPAGRTESRRPPSYAGSS